MTDDTTSGRDPSLKLHEQLWPKVLELVEDSGHILYLYSYTVLYGLCFHCSACFVQSFPVLKWLTAVFVCVSKENDFF